MYLPLWVEARAADRAKRDSDTLPAAANPRYWRREPATARSPSTSV